MTAAVLVVMALTAVVLLTLVGVVVRECMRATGGAELFTGSRMCDCCDDGSGGS